MNLKNLRSVLKKQPKFRFRQIKQAVFKDLIGDWSEVSTLPFMLRERLDKKCSIKIDARTYVSKDRRSVKALITLADGLKIETVLMCHKGGRNTVCVSSSGLSSKVYLLYDRKDGSQTQSECL